eukprot:gb/GECH01009943.1/.p1 GENE.gb/GECH01009943.1/~~gb/GECH01009943.1/.p1  ORF type:complete len:438 (+),score=124.06 gb/GECH01009943.1/:1-1314(+)
MTDHNNTPNFDQLSERGRSMLLLEPPPMLKNAFKARSNMYDAQENPSGFIDLATAQNATVWREIKDRLTQEAPHVPQEAFHYDQMTGNKTFRKALAETIFGKTAFSCSVNPDDLVVFTGSGAILDTISTAFTNPNDTIMIPSPYYGGFDYDFQHRPKARNITVPFHGSPGNQLNIDDLQAVYDQQENKPRMLVITNPMNPQASVLDRETLQSCVNFARDHKMEIVFDEIYANSVWGDAEFISALHLDLSGWEEHVHVVYGFSKDFGLDGFRIGILHTKSSALKTVCSSVSYFSSVSGYVQHVLARAIADEKWTQEILNLSKKRLRNAHEHLLERIRSVPVPPGREEPYSATNACIFGWFYLGAFLTEKTEEAEVAFLDELIEEERVVIAAGSFFGHLSEPGWYRISLKAHDDETLDIAHSRLVKFLKKRSEQIKSQN